VFFDPIPDVTEKMVPTPQHCGVWKIGLDGIAKGVLVISSEKGLVLVLKKWYELTNRTKKLIVARFCFFLMHKKIMHLNSGNVINSLTHSNSALIKCRAKISSNPMRLPLLV